MARQLAFNYVSMISVFSKVIQRFNLVFSIHLVFLHYIVLILVKELPNNRKLDDFRTGWTSSEIAQPVRNQSQTMIAIYNFI